MSTENAAYFRSRVIVERGLAKSADEPRVAAIHERFARSYEALVGEFELRLTAPVASAVRKRSRAYVYWLSAIAYAGR
jgi:hypothetical protein